jgi:hypothetical protein
MLLRRGGNSGIDVFRPTSDVYPSERRAIPSEAHTMNGEMTSRWRAIIARLEGRDGASDDLVETLDDLQAELQDELFGPGGLPHDRRSEIDPSDPRLHIVLDALATLALLAPDDPSYPWERAALLAALDRRLEAAEDYLTAARLFGDLVTTDARISGDEDEWAKSAFFKAAKNLALGGQPAAAATLLPRLDVADRAEVESLIGEQASRTIL